jgi:YHS domain-containing protein
MDSVEFVDRGRLIHGKTGLFVLHDDQAWFFASEENRVSFRENPVRYVQEASDATLPN